MRTILIFEPFLSGHRLEYIHHLHERAVKTVHSRYLFAVSDEFLSLKNKLTWGDSPNVSFLYIDQKRLASIKNKQKLLRIFQLVKIASNYSKEYSAEEVFFVSIMEYMPYLPFFFVSGAKISGIIYQIYLYEWRVKKATGKVKDRFVMQLFRCSRKFKQLFVLNDSSAVVCLNRLFKTEKFRYLPDPFVGLSVENCAGEHCFHGDVKEIYLHFGSLSLRKGTLNILRAINLIDDECLKNKRFVFAGKVHDDIKREFYALTGNLKNRVRVDVFDEFCEYSLLGMLCDKCNFILAPYFNTSFSSGIIAYAARYNKPVVVPKDKLLGKLVRKYRLGYLLDDNSPESIADFICNRHRFLSVDGGRYIQTHTVGSFTDGVMMF